MGLEGPCSPSAIFCMALDVKTQSEWLGELALALREESYQPDPFRRVFIRKANGKLQAAGHLDRAGSGLHDSDNAGAGADLRSRPSTRTVRVPPWEKCPTGGDQGGQSVVPRPPGSRRCRPRGLLRKHSTYRTSKVGSTPDC